LRLALLGVAVTAAGSLNAGTLFGDGLALMMTVSMSLMTVIARRHGQLPALLTACISSLVAASAVLPLGWISSAGFVVTWEAMAWLAGFGIMTMAVALPCYLSGAGDVPAGQAMLISALEMPFAPLWVWLVFAETPSVASLIGGCVVAFAILWQLGANPS
jgi:drug/metabolite transporter (DMT)-like permease